MNLNPKTTYVMEQFGVAFTKWFLRVCLPTLGATMVGALVYLLLILGLGLILGGCVTASEQKPTSPAAPPRDAPAPEPSPNDDCLALVHATCNHYALCNETVTEPPPAAYMQCQRHFELNVFRGRLCVDPGAVYTGPVDQCAAELRGCADVASIELVCGAVQVRRVAPEK